MRDGIILTVADDGTARVYYDTYDIVIHCESQEWRDKVKERIMGIKPKTTGSGFNHGEKDENWEARTTAEPSASDCWSNDNKTTNDSIVTKSSRYSTDRTTDGLISRHDAIKEAYPVSIDGEVFDVVQVETLMGLPSAQPETIIESDEGIKLQNSNDKAAKRLNDLIFDINPAEICSQIESDNLKNWCNIIQTEMKMAMVQLPCWGREDTDE